MKKIFRYFLRTLIVFLGIAMLFIAGVFVFVSFHKKDIIERVRKEVAEKLNGNVQIGNIELSFFSHFPKVSVVIKDLSITDTMFAVHHHKFFNAQYIYVVLGIGNAIQKNNPLTDIRLENAQAYIYTDTAGYTNAYLFTPKKSNDTASTASAQSDMNSFVLINTHLTLDDQKKKKLFDIDINKMNCKIVSAGDLMFFKTENRLLIHNLAFNTSIGSYVKETPLKGHIELEYDKVQRQLSFKESKISLKDQPFVLSGRFNFTDTPAFFIKIFTARIDYNLAKSLLTNKIANTLSIAQLNKPVDEVTANISGLLSGGEPLVNVNWKINGTDILSSYINLKNCSHTGMYTNEINPALPRTDPNSRLHFQNLSGEYEGIPLTCQDAFLDDLIFPVLKCNVKSDFELVKLNQLLGGNSIRMVDGKGNIDISYVGPIMGNNNQNTLINGNLKLSNGLMVYSPRNIPIKHVSGNIVLKNSDVFVTDFNGSVLGNQISMNGIGKNLLAPFNTNPAVMNLEWNVYSPSLNLNKLALLLKRKENVISSSSNKSGVTAKLMDEIVNYTNFRINLGAREIIYDQFKANNVNASISLVKNDWILNHISLTHAGGTMNISGSLLEKNDTFFHSSVQVNVANMEVNKLMYAFNNFGQKAIESKNLSGILTSKTEVQFDMDRNNLSVSGVKGFIDFSIKDGSILHYAPLKKIQGFIFKKRNLDEIYFAEIKNRMEIDNNNIRINRMEIQSTAFTMFIEGIYSLGSNTDISIQIPISNLKKRDEYFILENAGTDAKGGASIYLRGRTGQDGNVAFKLDLFKKLRKKKLAAE